MVKIIVVKIHSLVLVCPKKANFLKATKFSELLQGMSHDMEEGDDEVAFRVLDPRSYPKYPKYQIPLEEMPFQKKKPHKHISMGLCR